MRKIAAWDSVQPECRLPAAERLFVARRHDAHLDALKCVKPSIDNRTPAKAMGANTVKVALQQEEIDRTNQLLKTKLLHMQASNLKRRTEVQQGSVSTVASATNEKTKTVARENSFMRHRLEKVRSGLCAADQSRDFARHEKYLKQISKVKMGCVQPSSPSPPPLVPLLRENHADSRHTASSGWSDELWGHNT